MSKSLSILIVEDEAMIALGLIYAAEDVGATVIGPATSTVEALLLLANGLVDAAILDVNVADRDITPVALALIDRSVPFILHTGTGIPAELAATHPDLPMLMKPAAPNNVLAHLLAQLSRPR